MIYLDTSVLLKLVWNEPESIAVVDAIEAEDTAIVSVVAELETLVKLKTAYLGGEYDLPRLRRFEALLAVLRKQAPYEFRPLPARIFPTALRQHRNSGDKLCRSLDRLHLAAMEELEISRLMTHDEQQAKAAREMGFQVVRPGRG